MAPLSRLLSGLILPHDHFGNHLDSAGKTVDKILEVHNFQKAGKILAEVWNELVINSYPVVAEFIAPSEEPVEIDKDCLPEGITQDWYTAHVRESQYLLQVKILIFHNIYFLFISLVKNISFSIFFYNYKLRSKN